MFINTYGNYEAQHGNGDDGLFYPADSKLIYLICSDSVYKGELWPIVATTCSRSIHGRLWTYSSEIAVGHAQLPPSCDVPHDE